MLKLFEKEHSLIKEVNSGDINFDPDGIK